ncbi:Uncharacterized protein Rs2_35054 [Raphanus sativus]|nr:Uncharacterized protein Rs2_35054 [Raphanus sativus]
MVREDREKEGEKITTYDETRANHQIPTMETVMKELQEVTRQYLSCPDPVEAAARRQRVIAGDANGQMEEAALAIIKAAENNQAASHRLRLSDSNPVTPPPLMDTYNQLFPTPHQVVFHGSPVREEEAPDFNAHHSEPEPTVA